LVEADRSMIWSRLCRSVERGHRSWKSSRSRCRDLAQPVLSSRARSRTGRAPRIRMVPDTIRPGGWRPAPSPRGCHRLARARLADDDQRLAALDVEGDVVDRLTMPSSVANSTVRSRTSSRFRSAIGAAAVPLIPCAAAVEMVAQRIAEKIEADDDGEDGKAGEVAIHMR